tara:strand:+ start:14965 stop:17394 length:2430 start_codon:yes stop_codon:yes gene_type:complete
MESNYKNLQPRQRINNYVDFLQYFLGPNSPKIILSGDPKTGKSVFTSLILSKLLADSKQRCYDHVEQNPGSEAYFFNMGKLKKDLIKIFGIELDKDTDFMHLFGDYFLKQEGIVDLIYSFIEVYSNKDVEKNTQFLDQILEGSSGLNMTCLPGGEVYTDYTNQAPIVNFVSFDRIGASGNILTEITKEHYKAYSSTVLDLNSYNEQEQKRIEVLAQHQSLEKEQVLIQLYLLAEIQADLRFNNPNQVGDLEKECKDSRDSLYKILFEQAKPKHSRTKQFSKKIIDTIVDMDYDNDKKIQAMIRIGLPVHLVQQYFGKINIADIVTKNIFNYNENIENTHKVALFLLEEYYPKQVENVFRLIQWKHGFKKQTVADIFLRTLPYLLVRGYDEKELFTIVQNLGIDIPDHDFFEIVEDEKKNIFAFQTADPYIKGVYNYIPSVFRKESQNQSKDELTDKMKSNEDEYKKFKSKLIKDDLKPSGELSSKYLKNHIDWKLISVLEKLGEGLFAEIQDLRQRYDPNIFFLAPNINIEDETQLDSLTLLHETYPVYVTRFAWEPCVVEHSQNLDKIIDLFRPKYKYFHIWKHDEDIKKLTSYFIPVPHFVKALPELNKNLVKREEKKHELEQSFKRKIKLEKERKKQEIYSKAKKCTEVAVSLFNHFMEKGFSKKKAVQTIKQNIQDPEQKIKDLDNEILRLTTEIKKANSDVLNLNSKIANMYHNHQEVIEDFEKGFNQLPFVQDLESVLMDLCKFMHKIRFQSQQNIPDFDYNQFLADWIIMYPAKKRMWDTLFRESQHVSINQEVGQKFHIKA